MTRLTLLTSLFLLAACGHGPASEPRIEIQRVNIPVPVACVPAETPDHQPARAVIPNETGPAIQAITAELIERRAYDDQIEPVIRECRRAGQSTTG